jgi:hypothetical protein
MPLRKHQLRSDVSDRHQRYQYQSRCPGEFYLIIVRKRGKLIDQNRERRGFVENRGIDLYRLAKEKRLEGIIAKRKTSTYRPGKRPPDWSKIKA